MSRAGFRGRCDTLGKLRQVFRGSRRRMWYRACPPKRQSACASHAHVSKTALVAYARASLSSMRDPRDARGGCVLHSASCFFFMSLAFLRALQRKRPQGRSTCVVSRALGSERLEGRSSKVNTRRPHVLTTRVATRRRSAAQANGSRALCLP